MDHKDEIKLNVNGKVVSAIIITAVIVFAISFVIFKYIPDQNKNSGVNEYKKQIFDSVSCQYKCPLTSQTSQNKTQLLPDLSCVQKCTADLKTRQNDTTQIQYSDPDLKKDNLFTDIQNLVTSCKTTSIDQKLTPPAINNTMFFTCVAQGLDTIKPKYKYL